MAVRVLVIQFRSDDAGINAERNALSRVLGNSAELVFKNALKREVNWADAEAELAGFDGIILPGSAELYFDGGHSEEHQGRTVTSALAKESQSFMQYLIRHDIPTLGICFGHQMLANAVGTDIRHSTVEGKTGTIRVAITNEGEHDPLLEGVPRQFPAQYTHKDVVCDQPQGATVLVSNADKCRFAALRFAPHVYSVQFHPERSREDCIAGAKRTPEYLRKGADPEQIFSDSHESERILTNFISIASRKSSVLRPVDSMAVAL